jgi:hypothetical protein
MRAVLAVRWTCLSTCTNHPAGRLTLCGRGRFGSILGRFGHKRAAKARCSRDHGRTENGLGTCPWIQRFDPRSSCLVKPAVLYCMYIHTVSRLPTSAALWGPGVGRTKPSLGIRSPLLNDNMETRHKVMSFVLYVHTSTYQHKHTANATPCADANRVLSLPQANRLASHACNPTSGRVGQAMYDVCMYVQKRGVKGYLQ